MRDAALPGLRPLELAGPGCVPEHLCKKSDTASNQGAVVVVWLIVKCSELVRRSELVWIIC